MLHLFSILHVSVLVWAGEVLTTTLPIGKPLGKMGNEVQPPVGQTEPSHPHLYPTPHPPPCLCILC